MTDAIAPRNNNNLPAAVEATVAGAASTISKSRLEAMNLEAPATGGKFKTPLFAKRGFNHFLIGQSYERRLRRLAARNPPNESAPAARKPNVPGSGTGIISSVKLMGPMKLIV
jgi:hypothetical protein